MFTGLIQAIGTLAEIERSGDWRIRIKTDGLDLSRADPGASIACSGVCLTVIEKGPDWFDVQVSAETRSKTNIADWQEGMAVNLEPSLRMGDELGGHFVFGHVDTRCVLQDVQKSGESHILRFQVPEQYMLYIAPKGSVSLDGISLTVNEVYKDGFSVNIVPHTWAHTTLSGKNTGEKLNLEVDMLARYVAKMTGKTPLQEAA